MIKPSWAESPVLIAQLKRQQMINPDDVFGEIKPPAIDDIFRNNNRRGHSTFRPRSSSANWSGQDKLTREEIEEYARKMGYSQL
jgi:Inner centromere protein, ARK binding region